jgi:hypothetical protein
MEYISSESLENAYDVYVRNDGRKFYVLEGLSIEDQPISPPIQQFIHEHYAVISTLYWIVLGCTLIYLAGVNIIVPLMRRHGLY